MSNYKPVTNYPSVVSKLESSMGFQLPAEILAFWERYNLGKMGEITFYGLSATVNEFHNLLVGLAEIRGLENFPARGIPLFDFKGRLYLYDAADSRIYAYDQSTQELNEVPVTLETVVPLASSNKITDSFENDVVVVPDQEINWLARFLKNEIADKDRNYVLALAMAYSLEADAYSDNVLAYFASHHQSRIEAITLAIADRVLLDVASIVPMVLEFYQLRCDLIRTIPGKRVKLFEDLKEDVISKTRELSVFIKNIAV